MNKDKEKEFKDKLTALLKEYSVTLQPAMNINIVPVAENPQIDKVTSSEEK